MITGYNWPVISLAGRPTVIGFSLRCFGLHQHRDLVLLPHWQLLGRFCLPLSLFLTNQISGELSPTDIGGMESSKQLSQASCNPWICFDLFFSSVPTPEVILRPRTTSRALLLGTKEDGLNAGKWLGV